MIFDLVINALDGFGFQETEKVVVQFLRSWEFLPDMLTMRSSHGCGQITIQVFILIANPFQKAGLVSE